MNRVVIVLIPTCCGSNECTDLLSANHLLLSSQLVELRKFEVGESIKEQIVLPLFHAIGVTWRNGMCNQFNDVMLGKAKVALHGGQKATSTLGNALVNLFAIQEDKFFA
jgi:hypothetical protein